jgi:signal transduction histidine kinase/streptogramin lyase
MILAFLLAKLSVSALAAHNAAPIHVVDGSFVRNWLVLGPFPSRSVETDFLAGVGGEANVRPKEGEAVTRSDGTRLVWTRFQSARDLVDLERVCGIQLRSVAYAYCELLSERAVETDLRRQGAAIGLESILWLNGRKTGQTPGRDVRHNDSWSVSRLALRAGANSCMLKLRVEEELALFGIQPLPDGRATAALRITDPSGRAVPAASVEFYDRGNWAGGVTADDSGRAEAHFFPSAGGYDVHVTATNSEAWVLGVALLPGQRRELDLILTDLVSIAGRVLAMDGSAQTAIVVQAIRVPDSADSARAAQQQSPARSAERVRSLLPLPFLSATVHTDTNGNYRFLNLPAGQYRLRCHGLHGYYYRGAGQEPESSAPLAVESGRSHSGIDFVLPEIKKGVRTTVRFPTSLSLQHESIFRTPDGRLWVGTVDYPFQTFDGVEYQALPLTNEPNRTVLAMASAADGTLWVGSSKGISQVVSGQRRPFQLDAALPRRRINDVLVARDGTVWFGTTSGLCRYDGREFVNFTVRDGLADNAVRSLLSARDGALWIGTDTGLCRLDGRGFSAPDWSQRNEFGGAVSLHEARDGALWFRNPAAYRGAYRFDGKRLAHLGRAEGLLDDHVTAIAETSDGVIWLATWNALSRFNGRTIVNYTQEEGFLGMPIRDVFVDSDDVLWCAASGLLSRFDPRGLTGFGRRDGLINLGGATAGVMAFELDSERRFWIGTEWSGALRTDGKQLEPPILKQQAVLGIHRAFDGTLWFATRSGLSKYENGQTSEVLRRDWVTALSSDAQGNLWYGDGLGVGGLSRFNPKTGEERTFTTADGLPDNTVRSIERGSDGGMWVGTERGLGRFRDGRIEDFREKLGLPTGTVWEVRRDRDDALWIASAQGLHRLSGTNRLSITASNGLPNPDIRSSARTRDGIIWMGSVDRGLLGYDGKAVTAIDPRDGAMGNQVKSLLVDEDDSLWVGSGDAGLIHYRRSRTPPSVRLLDVRFDDQKLTDLVHLPSTEMGKQVRVRFQEIDLKTHPDKRQFWYQLWGPARKPLYAGVTKDRHFDWTPRQGGAYTFEVQAIDRDLRYSAPARMMLQVTVPWHANAWILTPTVGLMGGLLAWAFVARALYSRKSREAAVLRERVRISRDLHDHLGAGLTDLALAGDLVRQQLDQSSTAQMLASRLSASARELTRTMGEVIWMTDPEKDTLRSFVSFLSSYAERFFAGSAIRLRFDLPAETPELVLPTELRRGLFLAVKEALNNVAKHAEASELRVKLALDARELRLSIEDNGRGFLQTGVAADHRGLVNMEQRLRDLGGRLEIEGAPGQGTRIHARVWLPKK